MTTTLPRSPPACYFLDGMDLGQGIDAITGEIAKSGLDSTFATEEVNSGSGDASDSFSFRIMSDVTELRSSIGFSGSVTFPVDGIAVGVKPTLNFRNSTKSPTSVVLIVLNWERRGTAKRVASNAKLSSDAKTDISNGTFRSKYGDFFVYQISSYVKFTAVWKCTSENTSNITSFSQGISGSLSAIEVSAGDNVIGNAGNIQYDNGDIVTIFNNFREAAKPVPYEALLHHYSTIDSDVSRTIDMDPDDYGRVCEVYKFAHFVLFLIGIAQIKASIFSSPSSGSSSLYSAANNSINNCCCVKELGLRCEEGFLMGS
ncbi:hypothetical protein GGX14DRAFT_647747 [Mycena pura]|uniref:Uncharacterized protein n=1 Tax=Mycena pura TaxID=153505 RepID=A0AAD6VAN5_9AGAR|nr:hypothetical protein GGX14DRAFT_647747 [Mycena pura]